MRAITTTTKLILTLKVWTVNMTKNPEKQMHSKGTINEVKKTVKLCSARKDYPNLMSYNKSDSKIYKYQFTSELTTS